MTKVESYEHKLLFGLLGAYLAMSACSGASSKGNGESEVASIKIADLKDQDYDVVKLEISKVGQGESYKSSKTFQKGVESIEEKLPVGTYQFAIDYYKGQQKSLSSSYCSEEQKKTQTHTLAVGENKIKVLVCKLNKEPVNDEAGVVIEPTLPPEDAGEPTLGGEGPSGDCDPKFLAPFCKDERINGFDEGTWKREPPPPWKSSDSIR
ncbi:MAG: hypothetical protein M3Q07_15935 [Pseudobdellovibrionaceae bacterium]|nr:hypothetical protein [Pseudobdellovibrionaceae bacterium]